MPSVCSVYELKAEVALFLRRSHAVEENNWKELAPCLVQTRVQKILVCMPRSFFFLDDCCGKEPCPGHMHFHASTIFTFAVSGPSGILFRTELLRVMISLHCKELDASLKTHVRMCRIDDVATVFYPDYEVGHRIWQILLSSCKKSNLNLGV